MTTPAKRPWYCVGIRKHGHTYAWKFNRKTRFQAVVLISQAWYGGRLTDREAECLMDRIDRLCEVRQ